MMDGGYICERWMEEPAPRKKYIGAVTIAYAESQEKYDRFTTPKTSIRESFAPNITQYKAL